MFLEFQKITSSEKTKKSSIIVNSSTIISIEEDDYEDKEQGTSHRVSRIEVAAFPKYTFFTKTRLSVILSFLRFTDTSISSTGNTSCPNGSSIIYPSIDVPFIKTDIFFNSTVSESEPYVFNPSFLVYAEKISFTDKMTQHQETGLMISLRDSSPKNMITKLSYSQLFNLLNPTQIP